MAEEKSNLSGVLFGLACMAGGYVVWGEYEGAFWTYILSIFLWIIGIITVLAHQDEDTPIASSKHDSIQFDNGNNYEGEVLNDIPEGYGILRMENGQKYSGSFRAGEFSGQGIMEWPDDDQYEGDFLHGELHGSGIYKFADGRRYDGNWENGLKNGYGIFSWPDGDSYVGEFVNDEICGNGKFHYADGIIYEGEFEDEKRNGYGKQSWPNGDVYEGNFENDKISGYGTFINSNGDEFSGVFENGTLEGNGVYQWQDGDIYEGNFVEGNFNGYGFLISDGGQSKYSGEFLEDQRHGIGTLHHCDGSIYTGDFFEGEKCGFGLFVWPNGDKYFGCFEDDEANGHGLLIKSDGEKYEGSFFNGKYEGKGHLTSPDGQTYYGYFKNGKFIGENKISKRVNRPGKKSVDNDEDKRKPDSIIEKILPENKVYNEDILYVKYAYLGDPLSASYPIFQFPKKGTVIRSHRRGNTKRRGYKEFEFQRLIEMYFGEEFEVLGDARLNTGKETRPFEPDIAMVEKGSWLNLRIDIEIDEPYAGITRQPTHCKGEDAHRDMYFTDRGWMVIRFSEYQVHDNPLSCLRFIAEIIAIADTEYSIPDELLDADPLEEDELWDIVQAQKWQKEDYREDYLEHTFQVVEEIPETPDRDFDDQELAEEAKVIPSVFGVEEVAIAESFNLKNAHARDKRIKFYPDPHLYTIDNAPAPSVSTVISKFFPEFDAYTAAAKLGPANPLFGLPVHEIVELWKQKGIEAANEGTFLHKQIENYYLGKPFERVDEFDHFEKFVQEHQNLNPFRTEWRIFDERHHIAGTIDLVSKTRNGYEIYDWKRSKKVVNPATGKAITVNQWGTGLGDLGHLDDTSFNRYSLQQSIYKYILENNYGIGVSRMFLVVLHPEYDGYFKVEVPYLEEEAIGILKAI